MKQPVEVPQVGESVTSGILAVWNVADGDYVNEGDEIFELETDKATLPVPAPASGVISIEVQADEEVEIGTVVARIDTDASAPAGGTCRRRRVRHLRRGPPPTSPARLTPPATSTTHSLPRCGASSRKTISTPRRWRGAVTPSGKDGRLTKGDVQEYLDGAGGGGKKSRRPGGGRPIRERPLAEGYDAGRNASSIYKFRNGRRAAGAQEDVQFAQDHRRQSRA